MTQDEPQDGPGVAGPDAIYNAAQLIGSLEEGQFNADLSASLEDLVRDLKERIDSDRKGKGTLTIKIEFVADKGVLEILSTYAIKTPPAARRRSIMHVAGGRFLSRRDPRQSELPLRVASSTEQATQFRTVNN